MVDPHRAGLQLTRDAVGPVEVPGVYEGVQPVGCVVGDPHGLGIVAESDERHDRSEGFDLRQLRGVVDIAEDRGFDVIALREFTADTPTPVSSSPEPLRDGICRSRRGCGRRRPG